MATRLIKKKKLKLTQLDNRVFSLLKKQGDTNKKLMEKPTKTWVTTEPDIISELDKDNYSIITAPLDNDDGNTYKFLDRGTSVRFAQLSSNWGSKTTPNSLVSGAGSGFVTYIDTNRPQPGIEARNWSQIIVDTETPKFYKNLKKQLNIGLNRMY